jgi:hypothetical protein
MIFKLSMTSMIALGFCAQVASANCKAVPERYDLVDLGDVVDGQAESRAVAIDERGRVIVRAVPPGLGQEAAEYMIERNGKAKPVINPDTLAQRKTSRLVGDRVRLTDYLLVQEGFLPARATTLIDRKGGEIDVALYCSLPEGAEWELDTFVISDDGDQSAALFSGPEGQMVARCTLEEPVEILFETPDQIELGGINNQGAIGGVLVSDRESFLWRWDKGQRVTASLPEELLHIEAKGIDETGRVFALATGEVVNPAIYLDKQGDVVPALVLPGDGWDVDWISLGPCGSLFGQATYTNFATFVQLPVEEQYRLRQNFAEFWQYALERETELFYWSPDKSFGKFLGAVAPQTRDWSNIQITDINSDAIAIGYGSNELGEMRAIKLVPAKD